MPEPDYKVVPKGPKKNTLSKRIINCANRSDNCARAAYHRQYTSFKERATHLANRRASKKIATINAKLVKTRHSLEKSKVLAKKLLQNTHSAMESAVLVEQMIHTGNIKRDHRKYLMLLDRMEYLSLNMVATRAAVDVQMVLVNASKFLEAYPEIGKIFIKFAALMDPNEDPEKTLANLHKEAKKDVAPYLTGEEYAWTFKQHHKNVQDAVYGGDLDEEVQELIASLEIDTDGSEIQPAQNPNDPNGLWYVIS